MGGCGIVPVTIPTLRGDLYAVDHPGREPALVLMHGFPDDSRIYDRVVPLLGPRRVVAFDFLGYGRSGRPLGGTGEAPDRNGELAAVLDGLGLDAVVLVGHDASGPVAIDHALAAAAGATARVDHLILLNTYYGRSPSLRFPEMIGLFADPELAPLADAMVADPDQRLWLLQHTARRFGSEQIEPDGIEAVAVLPQFFGDGDQPDALGAIRAWTATLPAQLDEQDRRIAALRLAALATPVTLLFGERDAYLGPAVARHLASLFPRAEARTVAGASHWPQWDRPEALARLVADAVG
jgi:pimeloyl-ACP methyl ester carboxylesterase